MFYCNNYVCQVGTFDVTTNVLYKHLWPMLGKHHSATEVVCLRWDEKVANAD